MTKRHRVLGPIVLVTVGAACSSGDGTAVTPDTTGDAAPLTTLDETRRDNADVGDPAPIELTGADDVCPAEGDEWEVAKLYIEHDATDQDTGVHGLFGAGAWQSMCVTAPDGSVLWQIGPSDSLGDLGIAEFFFESREPPVDEYSIDDLTADFPAGTYVVSGVDFEGVARVGAATFAHIIPAEPSITFPELGSDPEADLPVAPAEGFAVTWDPVTTDLDGSPLDVTGYEVIVIDELAEDPNGFARPAYDVHVPGDQTSLAIPADFLRPGTIYELEVIAIEASGNQTISVGFFRTGP